MSNLLLDQRPLVILPQLAVQIGLNEAILLQQMWYWQQKSSFEHEEKIWFWKSVTDWELELPFFSEKTIKRSIKSLSDQKLINIEKLGPLFGQTMNRSNWYNICAEHELLANASGHNDPMERVNMTRDTYIHRLHTESNNICKPDRTKTVANKKKGPSKKRLPTWVDFGEEFTEEQTKLSKELRVNLIEYVNDFIDTCAANGYRYEQPRLALTNWLKRQHKKLGENNANGTTHTRSNSIAAQQRSIADKYEDPAFIKELEQEGVNIINISSND